MSQTRGAWSTRVGQAARWIATGSWLLATAVGSPLPAQQVATVTLRAPLSEHPEPLSQPMALLELRDGRVLVADAKERLLYLYDFDNETATRVSRQGGGPLEYQLPSGIFGSGDSILVTDILQQRVLVLDAQGTPRRAHRLVPAGDLASTIMKVGAIVAIDARGRYYSESRGMTLVPGKMPVLSDTVALVRWTSVGTRGDTIATRVEPRSTPRMGGNPTDGMRVVLPLVTFQMRDTWAVFPDGRVAVARAADYHTEWIDPSGRSTPGPRVPWTPLPITDGDKARARKVTREAAEQGLKLGASMAAGSGQKMPKIAMEVEEPSPWPKVRPPFAAVRAAPDGRLWVARTMAGYDAAMEYDILAPGGRLERRVRAPKDVALIGFGKGVLYAVRKDEDDLHYLQRYRYP